MTALDTRFRSLATRLIDKNGKAVTFTVTGTSEYYPSLGIAEKSSTDYAVKAIVIDHSQAAVFQSGGLVLAGDKQFTLAAAGITKPKPGDTITLNSVIYPIVRVVETWSGEEIAVYECQARI